MHHYYDSPIQPNAPMRLPTTGFCSCKASIHDIPVNKMLDFLYQPAIACEKRDANRKKRKTRKKAGAA